MRFMNASENQKHFLKTFILKDCLVLNIALKTQEFAFPGLFRASQKKSTPV